MARKRKMTVTPALRVLRENNVQVVEHLYEYVPKGGTATVAKALHVDEHHVIKTLVMKNDGDSPLLVLMHGDLTVSAKELARTLNCKRIAPVTPEEAHKITGYHVGGISPFGTRQRLPTYVETSISDLPAIYINGGHRGLILEMSPADLFRIVRPIPVQVGIP